MSKALVILSTLVGAALLASTVGLYLASDSTNVDARFDQGKTTSSIFAPPISRPEVRIVRHPNVDGSAVDDVLMRDGTTKHIVYDQNMILRQVFAYFKGADPSDPEVKGPLMYEKTHGPDGHLFNERHLRLDGSLEMDGRLSPADSVYVRHLYYPGASSDPKVLVVSSEQVFDFKWKPVSKTDFRLDRTRQLAHVWDKDGAEVVSDFADDGLTKIWQEKVKDGTYSRLDYMPDGLSVAVETSNSYGGTTFSLYSREAPHVLVVAFTFTNTGNDEIIIPDTSGKPLLKQRWTPDYSAKQVDGQFPMALDQVDHLDDTGKTDIRYSFALGGPLNSVTVLLGGGETFYGPRKVYSVDSDGWATKVETFDDKNTSDGGKALSKDAFGKHFDMQPWAVTRPVYELPKLKEGLKLRGEPPYEGPM